MFRLDFLSSYFIFLAAKIRRFGFSHRIPFANFIQRYSILAYSITTDLPLTRETCENILHKLKMQNWTTGTHQTVFYFDFIQIVFLFILKVKVKSF